MNQETITVCYQFDDRQASRIASSIIQTNRFLRIVPWLGALCFLLCGLAVWRGCLDFWEQMENQSTLLLFGVLFLFYRILMKWKYKKSFRKNSLYNRKLVWKINNEQLFAESGGAFRNEFSWNMITRAVETLEGFMLYTGNATVYWLPLDGFEEGSKVNAFRDLLKSHITNYKCYAATAVL